jgi:flagellum-specific ATP synthase
VLRSASRLMSHVASDVEQASARDVKKQMAVYAASRDLIELGAHQRGVNAALDAAIDAKAPLDRVLQQTPREFTARAEAMRQFAAALRQRSSA